MVPLRGGGREGGAALPAGEGILSPQFLFDGPSRLPARKQAAAQEGAFERPVAVHPASAEAGGLSCGIQAFHRAPVFPQHPPGQIRLQAAEGLAGQDMQTDGDERPVFRIEDFMGLGHPCQPVAHIVAGVAESGDLQIFRELVVHFRSRAKICRLISR